MLAGMSNAAVSAASRITGLLTLFVRDTGFESVFAEGAQVLLPSAARSSA